MGDSIKDLFGDDDFRPFRKARDPFGLGDLGIGPSGRPEAKFPPLPEPQATSLKDSLLSTASSGLHYVGSTLDKPARALRGLASGNPREALAAVPFSDTLGLTDPEQAVSMDELLQQHNLVRPNDPTRWEVRDFAVPALEIAADPLTWVNPLGGATKLGKLSMGLGATKGVGATTAMTRRQLTRGYDALEPALRAAGHSDEAIAHMGRQGAQIAPQALVDAAAAKGLKLDVGTPLRGGLGIGVPFTRRAGALGTGKWAQGLAGAQDWAVEGFKQAPGVHQLRTLFDNRIGRATLPAVGHAEEHAGRPARLAAEDWNRKNLFQLRSQLDAMMGRAGGLPGAENEVLNLMRGAGERVGPRFADKAAWAADLDRRYNTLLPTGNRLATGVQDVNAVRAHVLANWDEIQRMGGEAFGHQREMYRAGHAAGLSTEDLDELYSAYGSRRYIAADPTFRGSEKGRMFANRHGFDLRRKSPLRDVAGGTVQIDEWAINPLLSGKGAHVLPPDQVRAAVYADMERNIKALGLDPAREAEELASAWGKSNDVQKFLSEVDDLHAEQGIPYYSPDVIGDMERRGEGHARLMGGAAGLTRGSVDMARPIAELAAGPHVPLGDFLFDKGKSGLTSAYDMPPLDLAELAAVKAAGFRTVKELYDVQSNPAIYSSAQQAALAALDPAIVAKVGSNVYSGAAIEAYKQLARGRHGVAGFGPVEDAISGAVDPRAALNQYALTREHAASLSGQLAGYVTPTELKPFLGKFRLAQDVFKNFVYPMWPASHARNLTSAVYNNLVHGTGLRDYLAARSIRKGRLGGDPTRYGLPAGTTPEQAAHLLSQGAYGHGKVFGGVSSFHETVGARGLEDEKLLRSIQGKGRIAPLAPGQHPDFWKTARSHGWGNLNPLAQQGLGGGWVDKLLRTGRTAARTEDEFFPLFAGRRTGTGVEDRVRLAQYLGGLRQGMSPEMAGRNVLATHFDYSDLTPFERNYAKAMIPFYTFMRKNLPYQLRMMAEKPGTVVPMLRAMGATDVDQPWKPESLASQAAIPLGAEQGGVQRYLASIGLPIEEAFGRFKFRNYQLPGGRAVTLPSSGQTGLAFLGDVNPYFKAPVEYWTDTQFKTGRKLSDLYRGNALQGVVADEYAQPAAHVLANSPAARAVSTTNTLLDPRKGWGPKALNLLTGLRVSDVDLEKQRAITARDELERQLQADQRVAEFTNYYGRPGMEGRFTPDLVERLRLFTLMKAQAKAYKESQRAAGAR